MRTCSKCGEAKPLTPEHFQADSQKSSGFRPDCKACRHAGYARKRPDAPRLAAKALAASGLKVCCACRAPKLFSEFNANKKSADKKLSRCKPCHSEYTRARRSEDPAKFDEAAKAYKARNRDKVRERARMYAAKRRAEDPKTRLRGAITKLVGCFLRRRGMSKAGKPFFAAVGYSAADLTAHLERQFLPGMTWANYGDWHVDHIVPNAAFDYESMDGADFRACWALSNLRPLWRADNLKKGDKVLTLL